MVNILNENLYIYCCRWAVVILLLNLIRSVSHQQASKWVN